MEIMIKELRSNTMTREDWDKLNNLTSKDFEHCPFCGEQKGQLIMDITHKRLGVSKKVANPFYVGCCNPECMARGGSDLDPYIAIEKWNKRGKDFVATCSNIDFDYHELKGEMRIYDYFDNGHTIYDKDNIELLTPEILSNVCAFQYTEIGAEGAGGLLLMFDKKGNTYSVCYYSRTVDSEDFTAYDYIDKYLNLSRKVHVERDKYKKETYNWTTFTNGKGWYISYRDDVMNKMPEITDFKVDIEGIMLYFPVFFSKEKGECV